jgi:addiction module HigA family antidote
LRAFIEGRGITQSDLARAMGVSRVRVNQIVRGHAPITTEMALRLGKVTGTSPEYWLGLQREFDLARAGRRLASKLSKLPELTSSSEAH